jgi:flagellar protein FlbD
LSHRIWPILRRAIRGLYDPAFCVLPGTLLFILSFLSPITTTKELLAMIELTRLNGSLMVLNSDLIKTAEASPDTMLTLINGEKLIVRESTTEVVERVLAYRARLLTSVARRMSKFVDLESVVALASLDVSGQPTPPPAGPHKR